MFVCVTSTANVLGSRNQRELLVGDAKTGSNGTKERVRAEGAKHDSRNKNHEHNIAKIK